MPDEKEELPESMRAAYGDVELGPNDVAEEDQVPHEEMDSHPPHPGSANWNPEGGEGEEEYDPADHTVEEVLAYVGQNPNSKQAVLKAEKAGQNRVTLVEQLEGN